MQKLTVERGIAATETLEAFTDQLGGTFHHCTIVARREMGEYTLTVTFVTDVSPDSIQSWTMLNGSESIEETVRYGDGVPVVHFQTGQDTTSESVKSYLTHLLNCEKTTWWGSSVPYYE